MVNTCCVVGCANRHGRDKGCSFFKIPKVITHQGEKARELSERRRTAWLAKINRKDWLPGPGSRVCSVHFVSSKPTSLFDETNPDWVPSLRMGYEDNCSAQESSCVRYQRLEERRKRKRDLDAAEEAKRQREEGESEDLVSGVTCQTDESMTDLEAQAQSLEKQVQELRAELEITRKDNQAMRSEVRNWKSLNAQLTLSPDILKDNPQLLKFYTGIPEWTIFMALLNLLYPAIPDTPTCKLSKFSMVLMFLMKVRLNLFEEDLAFRFGVHKSTVSRSFHKVLDVMAVRTAHLIKWPDRDTLQETLPSSFRRFFKQCCIIIDCTEVFIERPSDLLARAQVWSNYKHHSTLKFLIGITPQGTISYVSPCAGGRMSDKEIVERSNLVDYLLPGDVVIADRGFTCDDYARMALAEVKTPPFTKGKKQLEKVEVDWSRELSIVRIHVERVIGILKQKYTILQGVLPIRTVSDMDEQHASVDKLVKVCCALVNLCPSVVPQD